jgi:hypothetical protein
MKAIFIGHKKLKEIDLMDQVNDEDFFILLNEFKIMESNVIYFSAGDAKIKDILICKDPSYSI